MAFRKNGWKSWAAGIVTALAARSADAQVYSQQAPSAPPGNQQPAATYPQYPNQQSPVQYQAPQNAALQNSGPRYQPPPSTRFQSPQYPAPAATRFQSPQGQQYGAATQAPANMNAQAQFQVPAGSPQYSGQPYGNQPYANQAPANPQYQAQPNAYGAQPGRQQFGATSAAPSRFDNSRMPQAPGVASYPEANRAPAGVRGGVRPAQFEQPIDAGQPAAAPAEQTPAANDPPGFRATEVSTASSLPNTVPSAAAGEQTPQEHPLMPALRWAKQGLADFSKIQDYSCTLVKRERIDGTLGEHEYIFVKVRHQPFSVYTYFLGPARVKGQEAIFVDGANDGSLLAHGNGIKHRLIGTVSLKPTSALAMSGNRYPITEMGMRRLLERLLEIGSNDVKYGECTVNWIQGAKVNNRTCTCIQVEHPHPRRNFLFHLARIYVDDEMQLPIRYEAYDWPSGPSNQPQLNEEYTFLNVKVNNGFTDADFSTENPSYGFK
ncbi:MAG TPA: DUF1571 domain-containing protein [Pirellulales bacterium]|nr:DUF1571 domain-containing protein [Pirellulales bacterium]